MARGAYDARTPADIRKIAERESIYVLADLEDRLGYPASKWTYEHLVAFQLELGSENEVLETFAPGYTLLCPIICPDASPQRVNSSRTQELFREMPSEELLAPECELLSGPGPHGPDPLGPFKVALAQARNVAHRRQPRVHPEREKRTVKRQDFVDSSNAIDGSSSPRLPSSSEFERGESEIDDDESEERSSIQEEVAVRLLVEFTRYVLQYCLEQTNAAKVEIRPRIERWCSTALVGDSESSGQDDGGVAQFRRLADRWTVDQPYLASFEVKRAQKLHECYQTNKYSPIVSNSTLAQNLGEAVLGWRANQYLLGQDFFLITASNTFVQFCHYKFGSDYSAYLDAAKEETQKVLVNDEMKDTSVRLLRSKPFDLGVSNGRKAAARHILSLLRWHQARDALQAAIDAELSSEDEDDSMGL